MFCLTLRILSFSYMHDKSIGCRLKLEFVAMELLRLLNQYLIYVKRMVKYVAQHINM